MNLYSAYDILISLFEETKPNQMTQEELSSVFDKLKPNQKIKLWSEFVMSSSNNGWLTLTVGRRSKSKKYDVEKISLQSDDSKGRKVKFYLYKRSNKISVAVGDMGGSLISIEILK